MKTTPRISTILLNWNRLHLLRVTVESYLATVRAPYELIIVDNASTDGSREFIEEICRNDPRHRAVYRAKNEGGRALNGGLRLARGEFLHTTENDLEYLPGWDDALLSKFAAFPELGQLSVFAPEPVAGSGEIWESHEAERLTRGDATIYLADSVGTSSIWRRAIWDQGFRWGSVPMARGKAPRFPNDFAASYFVRELGYWVAWNDTYTVINWGHNVEEWTRNLDYYLDGYLAKAWVGIGGLRDRLRRNGYDLIDDEGGRRIVRLPKG